jgi:hypothetical protein
MTTTGEEEEVVKGVGVVEVENEEVAEVELGIETLTTILPMMVTGTMPGIQRTKTSSGARSTRAKTKGSEVVDEEVVEEV